MIKRILFLFANIALLSATANAQVTYSADRHTGAVKNIALKGDTKNMNWMLSTDGSQYPWVDARYGWGLGYLSVNGVAKSWREPVKVSADGSKVTYRAGDIEVSVKRKATDGGFTETYTFTNKSKEAKRLTDIGVYTPWNDNYPNAEQCMTGRCHAHIWTGGESSYVVARRMEGKGQGVALLLTKGDVADYEIWERSKEKGMSNYRGVIALCPRDTTLHRGESFTIEWQLFPHHGWDDFERQAVRRGAVMVTAGKYVYEVGETAKITVRTKSGEQMGEYKIEKPGDLILTDKTLNVKTPRTFRCQLLGISSIEGLLQKRVDFILNHQQMTDPAKASHGAYMVYDNELNKIYENTGARSSSDTNDGRERIGMGVFLTAWYAQHPSDELKQSLLRYAAFVREKLQDADYTVWASSTDRRKQRGYNYPWVADFYLRMYEVTGDRQFAIDGYRTMQRFFERFGHSFYAINIPVLRAKDVLTKTGMTAECDTLMNLYIKTAHNFCDRGLNFPKHEVNYEQSIIAPALDFLCQVWLATGDNRCLEGIETLLPPTECFNGRQPSYHLNDIAIRHWDGYWFGKRQLFGDTFPHYWSTITATVFHHLSKIRSIQGRDDEAMELQNRAQNITLNNLCLFFEDGRASCAYLYPRRINGEAAAYYDSFANDQDWAAACYLDVRL